MRLYGTPPSHFTRKVRVLLQELGLPHEFVVLDKLLETGAEKFAGNPLHLFPVLEDGDQTLFDSNLICEYLIERYGKGKPIDSFLPSPGHKLADQQRLLIMNGGMSAGVTLIRAFRSGIENIPSYAFFQQEQAALEETQRWLDRDLGHRTAYYPSRFTMLELTLMCYVEWAQFREKLLPWSEIPNLERFVTAHRDRPSLRATHPAGAR